MEKEQDKQEASCLPLTSIDWFDAALVKPRKQTNAERKCKYKCERCGTFWNDGWICPRCRNFGSINK
jgi:rubrerythrin